MSAEQAEVTYNAIRQARSTCQTLRAAAAANAAVAANAAATNASGCSDGESQMIDALLARYPSPNAAVNQTVGFVSYVDALQALATNLGTSSYFAADARALLAEALMNLEVSRPTCTLVDLPRMPPRPRARPQLCRLMCLRAPPHR